MGGTYSARREITGKDGSPVGPAVVVYIPENGRDGPDGVRLPAGGATTSG
jgi:hypothetical protein